MGKLKNKIIGSVSDPVVGMLKRLKELIDFI